ncbi:hypothetical protein [Pseudalkalibacillus caeni]|uniref:Uncharacterized protein n=1 Tax=Exobacillus caeni TaxID=2574798 RepID=A0A5R9F5T0_9BACL|nr:hypothetical protein [Pseudalkalibacillus caeni]TLS37760.1 hypothetical protein FCL54_08030 [Pseudalkalibacillus caeni]
MGEKKLKSFEELAEVLNGEKKKEIEKVKRKYKKDELAELFLDQKRESEVRQTVIDELRNKIDNYQYIDQAVKRKEGFAIVSDGTVGGSHVLVNGKLQHNLCGAGIIVSLFKGTTAWTTSLEDGKNYLFTSFGYNEDREDEQNEKHFG